MIQGLFDSGAVGTLERLVQFTGERHRVLTHNIANLSTPNFRPRDIDPEAFQRNLREALESRRRRPNPVAGPLELKDTRQLRFEDGHIAVTPEPMDDNILFHDRNNRDLERIMQSLAENTLAHNAGIEMLKNEFDMLRMAIRERM